jgi:hypothetical protein
MSKSLIRKNQLHPDIADLISGVGDNFFVTPQDLAQSLINLQQGLPIDNIVYTTGNQTISGVKSFTSRPIINGTGVLLQGEVVPSVVENVVYTTGNQTISGVKSFTSRPIINGTGVLLQGEVVPSVVENVVYTTGNQTISGVKSFNSRPIINGTGVLLQGEVVPSVVENVVYTTGNQTISGNKLFAQRPSFNGSGLATLAEINEQNPTFIFPSDVSVRLSEGKSFGKYVDGDIIPSAGKPIEEVFFLAINETLKPVVNLSVTPINILIGTTNISTQLFSSFNIDFTLQINSNILLWKRGNESSYNVLSDELFQPSPFNHTFINNVNNTEAINYRYIVVDELNQTGIANANVSFLYGNYFGYSSAISLTTVAQIEALGNQVLSDNRARTVNGVTAGANLYTYYAYRAGAGDLTSIIQDGAAPVLGAFTKQSDVAGTNLNGASVTYRVYRSNATQAFTNNTLAFS